MLELFFVVVYSSLAVGHVAVPQKASVAVLIHRTSDFHCVGSTVGPRTMLTTCKCVGWFRKNNRDGFYEFRFNDVNEYVAKAADGRIHRIVSSIVSNHCRPSEWSDEVYDADIGGWRIEGVFDPSVTGIFAKPALKSREDYEIFYREVVGLDCFITSYNGSDLEEKSIEILHDVRPCIDRFCIYAVSNKNKWTCLMAYIKFNRWLHSCLMFDGYSYELRFNSSPVYCGQDGRFVLLGHVVKYINDVLIWARTDMDPNSAFWDQLLSWDSAALRLRFKLFPPALLTVLHLYNIISP